LLFSERGWVRRIRSNYLGPKMLPGTAFHDPKNGGPLVAACWSPGDGDLFLLTRQGQAIRFAEQQVPVSGCRGIRVPPDDAVITGLPVYAGSGVFLVADDGKGTIRLMSGFNANKAPGAGGKVAIKVDHVAGAVIVEESDDLFILSQLGKIIRFTAGEVPPKEGVVQGVHCISLRNDQVVAVARSQS
ncbi:MAG: hypothetical protein L0332_12760, partial [Chloroflexi bacterium]|nr:hypothetical protein [Chloroflexota bacterium]MCI0727578.1 hypothetical protein [Chloroflexota bacterium]